jgi:hypothetical protein
MFSGDINRCVVTTFFVLELTASKNCTFSFSITELDCPNSLYVLSLKIIAVSVKGMKLKRISMHDAFVGERVPYSTGLYKSPIQFRG